DRLSRAVLARLGHRPPGRLPELADGTLLADQHPRPPACGGGGEGGAVPAGRDDVRAYVAERGQPPLALDAAEASEAAPGDVLEEDALDRILGAEDEDLLDVGLDEAVAHDFPILPASRPRPAAAPARRSRAPPPPRS